MKTKELLNILEVNSGKNLLFEYAPGQLVGANYHITEVKNVTIDSVDCGARPDFWKETIIQLWESPLEIGKRDYMSAYKALSILKKVDKVKPMERDVEVKFEYSNNNFHTAQLFVNDYEVSNEDLILKLGVEKTDCKAKELCGVPETVVAPASACAPGNGCC
ncbi:MULTISPECIES: DUF6428 family protein [Maribacter]|uniref:DUF6428 family protein n=1 Tax=Maribacter flavus TaxID=1658664 RepID=A0A5B2TWU6_9FLAO|nr:MULTISPECIES: DUF6428 family protein [Maribacter]KAA2218884.1 hypothetical protein F0361_04500 [Maribacter flavus]MDC6403832.1 DUF6428 family protein [Maribacter sp. PR66]MEE1970973.1 DUF6428 family protein [Maribacter flavus]